jgi:hypothetical protein
MSFNSQGTKTQANAIIKFVVVVVETHNDIIVTW